MTVSGPRTQVAASSNKAVAINIRTRSRITMNPDSNVAEVATDEDQDEEEAAVYDGPEVPSESESNVSESEESDDRREARCPTYSVSSSSMPSWV